MIRLLVKKKEEKYKINLPEKKTAVTIILSKKNGLYSLIKWKKEP